MRRGIALPALVVAAVLVVWHGVILSLPHTHVDPDVPQEAISCAASLSGSPVYHLHQSGRAMEAHPCLACLAGSTFAEMQPGVPFVQAAVVVSDQPTIEQSCRSAFHAHLPDLRAPPSSFAA